MSFLHVYWKILTREFFERCDSLVGFVITELYYFIMLFVDSLSTPLNGVVHMSSTLIMFYHSIAETIGVLLYTFQSTSTLLKFTSDLLLRCVSQKRLICLGFSHNLFDLYFSYILLCLFDSFFFLLGSFFPSRDGYLCDFGSCS